MEEDGWEQGERLNPVIDKLISWLDEEASRTTSGILEEAEKIGLVNRIDTAIKLLRLCDEFSISPSASWDTIPNMIESSHQPEARIIDDGESDDPASWKEMPLRTGNLVRFAGGETIIGGHIIRRG